MARRKMRRSSKQRSNWGLGDGNSVEMPHSPSVKSKLLLEEGVFKSTVRTVGGSVKERGTVLETQMKKCSRHPPNVNCRVETFGKIVEKFKEMERRWVNEMGFGGLLWLRGRGLPRNLCYWLMTLFDPFRKVLMLPGGGEYPLHKSQVHWVFGLPHGPKIVPKLCRGELMKDVVQEMEDKYGDWVELKGKLHRVVDIGKVRRRLESGWHELEEKEFKVAFLIVALGDVLCPTTCYRLSKSLYAAVSVAMNSAVYDWCQLVVDNLAVSGKRFATKFYDAGYAKGAGGCSYFLAIMYLDHLNRTPIDWDVFPRVRVWTTKLVNQAREEDRYQGGGDYGKLGCLAVPYGKKHPLMAEDTMGPQSGAQPMAMEVAKLVLAGFGNVYGFSAEISGIGSSSGHAVYHYDVDEEDEDVVVGKRRRTGPADASRCFKRSSEVDLHALLSETELTAGSEDEDWCPSDAVEGDTDESVVNSDEAWYSEDDFDDDWVADEHDCNSTTDESYVDSDTVSADHVGYDAEMGTVGTDVKKDCEVDVGGSGKDGAKLNISTCSQKVDDHVSGLEPEVDNVMLNEEVCQKKWVDELDEVGVVVRSVCDDIRKDCGEDLYAEMSTPPPTPPELVSGAALHSCEEGAGVLTPVNVKKRRNRRGKKLSCKEKDTAFETVMVPRQHIHMRTKIVKFLKKCPRGLYSAVLLRCGEQEATVVNCRSVLCEQGGVDDNYIRVLSVLYTRSWRHKFQCSSIRVMLDPTLAMRLLIEKSEDPFEWSTTNRVAKSCAKEFVWITSARRFFVVFVPVLEKGHWWCVGYCVSSEEVWVIDSASRAPLEDHFSVINKLDVVMDQFFTYVDVSWASGSIQKWNRKLVKVEHQEDGYSCAIYMLGAVNKCAERFHEEFSFAAPIEDEREWLLTAHLMSEFNEARGELEDIVGHAEETTDGEDNSKGGK